MIDINFTKREGYNVNSLGYRAVEFDTVDWANSYIIQGCSAVFGLGIPEDELTISGQLSRMMDEPVINLGISGAGMMLQHYNLLEMLESNIKPKGVFILYPNMDRYPLYTQHGILNVGSWNCDTHFAWMEDGNSEVHNLYAMRNYRMLLELNNIPLYEVSHHKRNTFCKSLFTNHYDKFLDYGTDGQHWGPKTSKIIASLFYSQLK
jgi:hypothetical protein